MEIRIKSVHFDATAQLRSFAEKKISKLDKFYDSILKAEVSLKIVKPETVNNKTAEILLKVKGDECFVAKTNNTFEESIDECVEVLIRQLSKLKEKNGI